MIDCPPDRFMARLNKCSKNKLTFKMASGNIIVPPFCNEQSTVPVSCRKSNKFLTYIKVLRVRSVCVIKKYFAVMHVK